MPGLLAFRQTRPPGRNLRDAVATPRFEVLEAAVAAFVVIAIVLAVAAAVLFAAFVVICLAIRKEDRIGTLAGRAPNRICRGVRHMTGWHWTRWV
jgi:hypothetical protein